MSTRSLKKIARKMYPNASNIILGSNNITCGVWVEVPGATSRYFIPRN